MGTRLISWNCFTKSVCVYLPIYLSTYPTYLPIFVCPYKLIHMSKFLSGKRSLYTWDKSPINPAISYCASKLRFEGGFLFQAKKRVWRLTTDIKSGFHSGLFWCSLNEKQQSKPVRLTGNAYLIVWKVGMTRTYVNENEEQPEGFAERIFKE